MKHEILLIIGLMFATTLSRGQQIEISGLNAGSTAREYKNNWGYDLGYNHFMRKNRLGISFRQYFNYASYDDIHTSTEDGTSKYINEYDPENKRSVINLIYSFSLVDNENSVLYLGCSAGLNYYRLKGTYIRTGNGDIPGGDFSYHTNINNRLGLGMLIEYELKKILSERFSTSIKINPELSGFEEFGTVGGYSPWMIGWMNFSIGFKYRLSRIK